MTDWLYKATRTRANYALTAAFANQDGFLCRTPRNVKGHWVTNARRVDIGDTIYFFFKDLGATRYIGTFEVVDAQQHAHPTWFGTRYPGSALFQVVAHALTGRLRAANYLGNPVTGWCLQRGTAGQPHGRAVNKFLGETATLVEF